MGHGSPHDLFENIIKLGQDMDKKHNQNQSWYHVPVATQVIKNPPLLNNITNKGNRCNNLFSCREYANFKANIEINKYLE